MTTFLSSNNTVALYLDPTGVVGIGTSNVSTSNAMTVNGYLNVFSNLIVQGTLTSLAGINNPNAAYIANSNDSAVSPSFTWSDGSNYGMYRYSNNAIGFSVNATPVILINSAGNLIVNSNFIVSQNTVNSNALSNLGNAYFASNMIVNGVQSNIANASFSSNIVIGNNLYVNQNVVHSNIMSNLGAAYFGMSATFNSNVSIMGLNQLQFSSNFVSYVSSSTTGGTNGFAYRLRVVDPVNTSVRLSIGNLVASNLYDTRLDLYSLGVVENSNSYERLFFEANSNGGSINWLASNLGSNRPLAIYSNTIFQPNGSVIFQSNIVMSNTLSNLNNAYFASNVVINGTSSNLGNTYFASNVAILGLLSNGGFQSLSNLAIVTSNILSNGINQLSYSNGIAVFSSNAIFSNNVIITGTLSNSTVIYSSNALSNYSTTTTVNLLSNNLYGYINGGTAFPSNLSVSSNLYVMQNTIHSNTLSNLGNAYFASNVAVAGVLSNPGIQWLSNFSVTMSNTYSNGINQITYSNGIAVFSSNIVFSNITSNLGNSYFASNVVISGFLSNSSVVYSSNALSNYSTVTSTNTLSNGVYNYINGTAAFPSNITVSSNLYVNQNTINSNTLSNLGNAYFASNVTISNIFTTNISTSNILSSNITSSNITVSNLTVNSNILLTGSNTIVFGNSMMAYVNPSATTQYVVYRYRSVDAVNTNTRISLGNSVTSNAYITEYHGYAFGVSETSNYERFVVGASSNGSYLNWSTGGTGTSNRPLTIYSNTVFQPNGSVAFQSNVVFSNNTSNLENSYFASNVIINGATTISNVLSISSNLAISGTNQFWFSSNQVTYVNPSVIGGQTGYTYRIRTIDPINTSVRMSLGEY